MSEKPAPIVSGETHPVSGEALPLSEKPAPIVSEVAHTHSGPESKVSTEGGAFFPWLDDEGHKKMSIATLTRFPIMGAVGLIGSALTVLLSFLVLHFFNKVKVIGEVETGYRKHLPKPAAFLSIVLSLNTALVHLAVSQGVAVTWWYRASRDQTTVADLHNVWATGTSVVNAVTQYKAFNYIALATVMVATLPANGILLQNAMTTQQWFPTVTDPTANFSLAFDAPYGFSAALNKNGSVAQFGFDWQDALPYVIGNQEGFYGASNLSSTCQGWCLNTPLTGIGFNAYCDDTPFDEVAYDLPIDSDDSTLSKRSNDTSDSTILSVEISWDVAQPYAIDVRTKSKSESACSGTYTYKHCTLQLGTVPYLANLYLETNQDTKLETYHWWTITPTTEDANNKTFYDLTQNATEFRKDPNRRQEESGWNDTIETDGTTFGGVAAGLADFYNSRVIFSPATEEFGASLAFDGFYAKQLQSSVTYNESCEISFAVVGGYSSPMDAILSEIRDTFFYTSVWLADPYENYVWGSGSKESVDAAVLAIPPADKTVQTIHQQRDKIAIQRYKVIWYWWGASCGVTFFIILFILPTYYGFWTLARKTTMSPFETARAFHAPILSDQPTDLDTPALLHSVGHKCLHTDLALANNEKHG